MLLIKQVCAIIVSKGGVFVRSVFYSVINDIKFKEQYMERYKIHAERIEGGLSIFCALASAGSIFAWTRWTNQYIWWSLILLAAQIVQIVKTYLPYSRRLDALKYLIPEMHLLVIAVENKWFELESLEDADYTPFIREYRTKYADLDSKYLGPDPLPDIKRLRNKAASATDNHLKLYIGIVEGGEEDAKRSDPQADSTAVQGTGD